MKNIKILTTTRILISALLLSINISASERSCHDIVSDRFSCLEGRLSAIVDVLLYLDKGDQLIDNFKVFKDLKDTNNIYKYRKEHDCLPPTLKTQAFYKKTYKISPEIYNEFPSIHRPEQAKITAPHKLQIIDLKIRAIEAVLLLEHIHSEEINVITLAENLNHIEEALIQKPLGIMLLDFLESMDHWGPCICNAIQRLESTKSLDFLCCICHGNALKPILCKKSHTELICLACLRQTQENGNKCPVCKISLAEYYH